VAGDFVKLCYDYDYDDDDYDMDRISHVYNMLSLFSMLTYKIRRKF
jgi:hypothetical protein